MVDSLTQMNNAMRQALSKRVVPKNIVDWHPNPPSHLCWASTSIVCDFKTNQRGFECLSAEKNMLGLL